MEAAPERQVVIAEEPTARSRKTGWLLRFFAEEDQERIALFLDNPLSIIGLLMVLGWLLIAVFAYNIAPFPADAGGVNDPLNRLQGPSAEHWFGTDHVGRDIFSRVVIGTRISMTAGIVPILVSLFLGVPFGAVAGYYRGILETLIMRGADSFLAMPKLLLAIAISAALGPSLQNAMLAIIAVWWPYYARLVYGVTLSLKERDFIEASRGLGVSNWKIILRHILPNSISSIIVMFTMDLGFGILTMASLSFVGMGAQPPSPEWGLSINIGRAYMPTYWWLTFFPGMAIFTLVLGFNLIGDGLRDALDPRRRR